MKLVIFILFSVFATVTFAEPIVDLQGKSEAQYKKDYEECKQQAALVMLDAMIAPAMLRDQNHARVNARITQAEKNAMRLCLVGRGYSVLN